MARPIQKVVLVGASGNLGPTVLNEFLRSSFEITVITRQESDATFPENVTVIKASYTFDSLVSALTGQDAVVSLVGAGGVSIQKVFIDAAIKAGVKRFLSREFGCDTSNPKVLEISPFLRGKREIVEYLQSRESDIGWTALITGPFADVGITSGFLQFNLQRRSATIWDDGTVPFTQTTMVQVGRALVSVLQLPAQTANQYVYVESYTASQMDILKALQNAAGTVWGVTHLKSQDRLCGVRQAFLSGAVSGDVIVGAILGATFAPEQLGNLSGRSMNRAIGLEPEGLDEVARQLTKSRLTNYGNE